MEGSHLAPVDGAEEERDGRALKKVWKDGERGTVLGVALGMVALAFLLPALCFGGAAQSEKELAESEDPAVLTPLAQSEYAETLEMDVGTGELDRAYMVWVLCENGTVQAMDMGEYLWGVVAAEMPAAFETEALKAQAVAARTYTLWKSQHNSAHMEADICMDFNCCQAWLDPDAAAEKWGENAALYSAKISAAITGTDGMVLCWEGQPIQAVFHSSSAGRTEDAVAVWGSTVPYLLGVDSPEGTDVPNYHSFVTVTADELAAALEGYGCDLSGDPEEWIGVTVRTESGMVVSMEIGGAGVKGTELRSALGLRSSVFSVDCSGGVFTFSVTGYGHGVGMSQYGANTLAEQGETWRDIVAWYYTGVTVETYPA